MNTEYQGALSTDRVELDGKIIMNLPASATASMTPEQSQQIKVAQGMFENMSLRLTAERTGDCS